MPGDVLRPWRHLLPRSTADRYQQRLRLSTEASAFEKLDTSREETGQESIRPYCSWLNSRHSDSSLPCADCLDFSAMPGMHVLTASAIPSPCQRHQLGCAKTRWRAPPTPPTTTSAPRYPCKRRRKSRLRRNDN